MYYSVRHLVLPGTGSVVIVIDVDNATNIVSINNINLTYGPGDIVTNFSSLSYILSGSGERSLLQKMQQ